MFSCLRKGVFNHLSKSCQGKQFWKLKAQILIKRWSDMSSSLPGSSDWKNGTQLLPVWQKWDILFLSSHGEHCQCRCYCVSGLWLSQQPITFYFCHSVTEKQVRRDMEMLPIIGTSKGSEKAKNHPVTEPSWKDTTCWQMPLQDGILSEWSAGGWNKFWSLIINN